MVYKLGSAAAGFDVRALVRVTAARVACDGVAETVLLGGKSTDTFRVKAVGDTTGTMVVMVSRGAVACLRASETSCVTEAWEEGGCDAKERVKVTVAW